MDFNGTIKELFPTGKSPEPSVTKLSNTSFALGKDSQSIIMDTKGDLVQNNPIKWSDSPSAIGTFLFIIESYYYLLSSQFSISFLNMMSFLFCFLFGHNFVKFKLKRFSCESLLFCNQSIILLQ